MQVNKKNCTKHLRFLKYCVYIHKMLWNFEKNMILSWFDHDWVEFNVLILLKKFYSEC